MLKSFRNALLSTVSLAAITIAASPTPQEMGRALFGAGLALGTLPPRHQSAG